MNATSPTEAELDAELAGALRTRPDFAQWFLEQTNFKTVVGKCVLCRDDNPWSRVISEKMDPDSGTVEVFKKDRETDVLAIYETDDARRIALHIENKLEDGYFTSHQPESYRERLTQWRKRKRLGMYVEATSVLVAPRAFYDRNKAAARVFESYVSHEDIAQFIDAFKRTSTRTG
jgi:hypothetical protein